MMSVEDRLKQAAATLDLVIATEARQRSAQRTRPVATGWRSRRTALLGAGALVLAGVAAVALMNGEGDELRTTAETPGLDVTVANFEQQAPSPTGVESVGATSVGWERFDLPFEARAEPLSVSTDNGMFIWGGWDEDSTAMADGFYFDGDSDSWKSITNTPQALVGGRARGVWTGEAVVVVNDIERPVAAAFEPRTGDWRMLGEPPVTPGCVVCLQPLTLDSGQLAFLNSESLSSQDDAIRRWTLAIWDPSTGESTTSEAAPLPQRSEILGVVSSGAQIHIVLAGIDVKGNCTDSAVVTYDPATSLWAAVPIADQWLPRIIAWTSRGLLLAGGTSCSNRIESKTDAVLFQAETGTVTAVASLPAGLAPAQWDLEVTSTRGLVATVDLAGRAFVYDVDNDSWHVGRPALTPDQLMDQPIIAWVGDQLVLSNIGLQTPDGQGILSCCTFLDHWFRYRVPEDPSEDAGQAANRAPIASDDLVVVEKGSIVANVLANDVDLDGDSLTIVSVETPNSGTAAVVDGGRSIQFTAANGQTPGELLEYMISDGRGATATALLTVAIFPPCATSDPACPAIVSAQGGNARPVAIYDDITLTRDPQLGDLHVAVYLAVLENDFDPEGGPLSLVSVSSSRLGANVPVAVNEDGSLDGTIRYEIPASGDRDVLSYVITDELGQQGTGFVFIEFAAPCTGDSC